MFDFTGFSLNSGRHVDCALDQFGGGKRKRDEVTGHTDRKRICDENVYGFMSDEKLGEAL